MASNHSGYFVTANLCQGAPMCPQIPPMAPVKVLSIYLLQMTQCIIWEAMHTQFCLPLYFYALIDVQPFCVMLYTQQQTFYDWMLSDVLKIPNVSDGRKRLATLLLPLLEAVSL